MDVFAQLFKSPVGMMSLATIAFIIVIAVFMFFWVKKQADNDKKINRIFNFLLMCVCLGVDE